METMLRNFLMLQELPVYPRKISTSELKARLQSVGFETTIRTIQRDLNKLSGVFPLLTDNAKPQGWSWQGGVKNVINYSPTFIAAPSHSSSMSEALY